MILWLVAGEMPIPTSALLGPPIESDSEDAAEDYEPAGQPGSDVEPKGKFSLIWLSLL